LTFLLPTTRFWDIFDPDKIDKVVFNLLSNAHKYTPEGGEVKVALELIDENKLLIQVSDTGIGISEKEQELIFTTLLYRRRTENKRFQWNRTLHSPRT